MANRPHFITDPVDSSSYEFRLDCMAWQLFNTKTPEELAAYIKRQPKLQNDDFTNRLRKCRAWWMLTYLNRGQIEIDLQSMQSDEEQAMRDHLNQQRQLIKLHKRNAS